MVNKTLIAILGPTASGKTAISLELARKYNTSIISADSRQFYRETEIGTAKPSAVELAEVPHYFINNLSITQHYTAGIYEQEALKVVEKLFLEKDVVILTGGSTLYIHALLHGIDPMPAVSPQAKEDAKDLFERSGIEGIRKELKKLDPAYFAEADISNHRRLIRALEVCLSSGHPYSLFLNKTPKSRPFRIIKRGLDIPRPELYERINRRCEIMLNEGLLEEVKALMPYKHLNPLHTVGYSEFFDYLDGKTNYNEAVSLFKQHTRNYAKRQMTWFRKESGIIWSGPELVPDIDFLREADNL